MADNDINNEEQYKRAADRLKNYISTTDFKFSNKEEIEKIYDDFRDKFSPEKLEKIPDNELLEKLFIHDGNQNNLCYALEYDDFGGGIGGGSAYNYPVFKAKKSGEWKSGTSQNPVPLTEDEALNESKKTRDLLIKGYKYIESHKFDTINDYISFYENLEEELKNFTKYIWVKKYYHMIFPNIFNNFHKDELQKHILYGLGIVPGNTYYEKCGQLVKINRIIGCLPHDFSKACLKKFGDIKTFYRLGSSDGDGKKYADEWQKDEIVAIGWSKLGSLRHYVNSENKINTDLLKNKLMEIEYNGNKSISSKKANEIKNFYESDKNTIFVVADGEKIIGLVDDIGEYNFEKKDHMAHSKKCNWAIVFQENTKLPKEDEGNQRTCSEVKDTKNLLFLYNIYYWSERKLPNKTISSSNKHYNSLNTILYGPPGTGKTYNTVIEAMRIINPQLITEYENKRKNYDEIKEEFNKQKRDGYIEFITFHQSYAYEEFVEGIKPDLSDEWGNSSENLTYKGTNGVFKKIVLDALYERLEITEEKTKEILNFKEIIDEFCEKYIPDGILETKNKSKFTIIECTDKSIKTIPNNGQDGKITYLTLKFFEEALKKEEKIENVKEFGKISGVGRSSYYFPIYEELYKIKTQINKNNVPNNGKLDKDDHLVLIKEYYENKIPLKKDINESQKYVLIIDEINRGNISKIFGELITLIEEDKRENLSVRLPYSHEEFTVPKNLYIIGTMNTSDRSIASIDIALRRRFTFKEMMPDSNLVADFGIKFKNIFEELNNRIRILLDRDHQIGHSYFIKTKYNNENNNNNIKTLKEIWFNCIMPLLNEYFYNDWEKLIALLGEPKKEEGNDNHWSSFIKKIEATTFAIDYEIDNEEQYDFVSESEINFKEALNHAFPMKSS